ncbi:DUF4362 domain-containing protein [Paenibacillus sp. 2TAB23]|uniref:DUF4362 domain-containing protein n=1 Tax=Paenibacillus sp. 2TAB23 TaxID=3233004 RepID=UPI003F9CC247
MKRDKATIAVAVVAFAFVMAGCTFSLKQPASNNVVPHELKQQYQPGDTLAEQVTVSRSLQFGTVNSDVYGILKQSDEIMLVIEALQGANKIEGMLDVRTPDYDIIIEHEGSQRAVHLWLDPVMKTSMYTEVSDTGTGYTISSADTEKLKEIIFGITYGVELAVKNGDVVNALAKWHNVDVWEEFLGNVKSKTADEIHVTSYTIEGGAIFQDLIFDGQNIAYTFDSTHDAYENQMKQLSFCSGIATNKTDEGKKYTLSGFSGKEAEQPTFSMRIP